MESSTGGMHAGIEVSDAFIVDAHLASDEKPEAPTTVGVVTWSLPGTPPDSAWLEFGLTTAYGMKAQVDLGEADFRTLLLGMKPERTYHYRVVISDAGAKLASPDFTIRTGARTSKVTLASAAVVSNTNYQSGFLISSYWRGGQETMAFVLDEDGEVVWWYDTGFTGGVGKAALSADGKSMWLVTASNSARPLQRVSLDVLEVQTYDKTRGSHDIHPVMGEVMAYVDYSEDDCDSMFEIENSGETKEIIELSDAEYTGLPNNGGGPACHGNAIGFNADKEVYTMSSYGEDIYFTPRAGGAPQKLSDLVPGGHEAWGGVQHGMHLLADSIVIFANWLGEPTSVAHEYSLADGTEIWRYEGPFTANYGGVQRLSNGNTVIAFSNAGIIRQVTPEGHVVHQVDTGGKRLGYVTFRPSLYGPPTESGD